MTGTQITLTPSSADEELAALARRYRRAGGPGLKLLNVMGAQADDLMDRLPRPVVDRLNTATTQALRLSVDMAQASRVDWLPDGGKWSNSAAASALGAVGGTGGLPTAMAELPVTVTMLMRAILSTAARHGADTDAPEIRRRCVQVFASAGPLAHDDAADLGFLAVRSTLTGSALQALITRIAPRLATALGQKLAAQTVPVLGAVAGAGTNLIYANYYQDMAHISFGLMRLSAIHDIPEQVLVDSLRTRLIAPPKV